VARSSTARAGSVLAIVPLVVMLSAGSAFADERHKPATRPADTRPTVTVSDVSIVEPVAGASALASFTVSVSAAPAHIMFLPVHTENGTARWQTGDYVPIWRLLAFTPDGPTSKTVNVRVRGDAVTEGAETFALVVTAGIRHGVRDRLPDVVGTATITPATTPPPPPPPFAVNVTDASVSEPHTGGLSDGVVSIAPVQAAPHDVVVTYELVGVDATAGSDFVTQTGTLTFVAGSTAAQNVVVTVVGDDTQEVDETFRVQFHVADNSVTLTPSFATVTIVDNTNSGPVLDPQ
jgi:hypothetical protein